MEFIRPLPVIAVDRRPGTFGPLVHMIVVGAAGVRLRHREDRLDPTWATVHGLAVLLRGPVGSLTDREKTRLEDQTLTFIGASVS
jgi:hypothetical protein